MGETKLYCDCDKKEELIPLDKEEREFLVDYTHICKCDKIFRESEVLNEGRY